MQKASKIEVVFNPNGQESPSPDAQAAGAPSAELLPEPPGRQVGSFPQGHNDQRKFLSTEDHQTGEGKSTRKWFQRLGCFISFPSFHCICQKG